MEFKKGDLVECWDYDDQDPETCEYFYFNDHPKTRFSHLVRRFYRDGSTCCDVTTYKHCRPVRPDLEIDDPVWVWCGWWEPAHFFGWAQNGRMKYWSDGRTSHTATHKENWSYATRYSLTPPESEI